MAMSKEELFEKAKKRREEEKKKEKKRRNFTGYQREDTHYTALTTAGGKVVRLVGNPMAVRQLPSDPRLSLISFIVGDDDKKFRCVWPFKEEKPNWILWKVYNLVMRYSVEGSGESFRKNFLNEKTHPECFYRVAKNNRENKFESGWRPTQFVLMNVIDRHDSEFHEKNKHTKILSKKASQRDGASSVWYEPGVPITTYNAIWDDVAEYYGNWEDYDVVIRKKTESPWYTALHGIEDKRKLTEEEFSFVVDRPLTEEERNYKKYDLDLMFGVTSYTKIKSKLGNFIKKVDVDFSTNFYEELDKLVEEEQAEWEKNKPKEEAPKKEEKEKEPEESNIREFSKDKSNESNEPEDKPSVRVRSNASKPEESEEIPWDKLTDGSYNGTKYVGVKWMTDEEKQQVVGINEDGSFKYKKGIEILENQNSGFLAPESFHIDPLNGELFE